MITQQILAMPQLVVKEVEQLNDEIRRATDLEVKRRLIAKRDHLLQLSEARPLAPGDQF